MAKKLEPISSLKIGTYIIFDNLVCKVTNIQTSRPGRHGHAKSRVEAISLDGQKKIFVKPAHDKVEVPIIEKRTAQVLSIKQDIANVMDLETYETFDLKIPVDLKDKIKENSQIIYWILLDKKILKQLK